MINLRNKAVKTTFNTKKTTQKALYCEVQIKNLKEQQIPYQEEKDLLHFPQIIQTLEK